MKRTMNKSMQIALWMASSTACAAPNTVTIFDVIQFGMPGEQKYIFCAGKDCQSRTIKHIQTTGTAPLQKLTIPEPIIVVPPIPPPEPVASKPALKKKKIALPKKRMEAGCGKNK